MVISLLNPALHNGASLDASSVSTDPSLIDNVLNYINRYWVELIRYNPEDRQTLIGLPYRYLVPSNGAMFQEMYYWDSYFMSLGLVGTGFEELIVDMTENLAYLYKRFGIIPNASRYYFLSRSQPPLFSKMIWLAFEVLSRKDVSEAENFLDRMMQLAEHEHDNVWMGSHQPHPRLQHRGLSRYFDINFLDQLASCESGWDHSNRCQDNWLHHLPVCLNSILYAREKDFARAAVLLGNSSHAQLWDERAAIRAQQMSSLMWNEEEAFFFDYDLENSCQNVMPTLAGFYPLWARLATPLQAEKLIHRWLPLFEREGGLVTSLDPKKDRQWAFPNGWAPLQSLMTEGLDNYGYHVDANRIREKWCRNNARVFASTGALWEKYNVIECSKMPEAGLYGSVSGFGWTNSVFVHFYKKLLATSGTAAANEQFQRMT
ncbi:MAG TPA: trehalase family glycosidase [Planktothrix sp.]|jgi:alpha,alpha-trehalase